MCDCRVYGLARSSSVCWMAHWNMFDLIVMNDQFNINHAHTHLLIMMNEFTNTFTGHAALARQHNITHIQRDQRTQESANIPKQILVPSKTNFNCILPCPWTGGNEWPKAKVFIRNSGAWGWVPRQWWWWNSMRPDHDCDRDHSIVGHANCA